MTIATAMLLVLVLLAAIAALVLARAARRFRALARDLAAQVAGGVLMSTSDPPDAIRARAVANGAGRDGPLRAVRLTQEAEFRRGADAPWGPMPAVQHIGLGTAAFVWSARAPGPLVPSFTVIDAYVGGAGVLRANLFGAIPVANARGPVYDRSEAMRYLAELPWAPDAVLGNPEVTWCAQADGTVEAALETPAGRVAVRFVLNADGDIVEMNAERPDLGPDGAEIARTWRGHFGEYAWVGGRRIPRRGEVGYVANGEYSAYWRGRITGLELLP